MAATDFRQIVINYQFLLDTLEPTKTFTDHLETWLVVNSDDVDFINNGGENKTRKARVERLVNALRQKGDDRHEGKSVWDRLVLVLEETCLPHIALKIKNTDPETVPYSEDGLYDLPATGDVSGGYEQIKDQSVREINSESRGFQSCPNFVKALELAENRRTLFIAGPKRSGKTAIGAAILRHYRMRGWAPLVLDNYDQFRQHVGGNRRQVLLLDDVFEHDTEKVYKSWKRAITILSSLAEENRCYAVISIESETLSVLEDKYKFQHPNRSASLLEQEEGLFGWPVVRLDVQDDGSEAVRDTALQTYMRDTGRLWLQGVLQGVMSLDFAKNHFLKADASGVVSGLSLNAFNADVQTNDQTAQTNDQTAQAITQTLLIPLLRCQMQSLKSDTAESDSHFANPPLHVASKSGDAQVVRFLLACHTDINCKDRNGATALLHAVSACQAEIAAVLLNAGARPDLTQKDGWGPVHFAASKGYDGILEMLIRFKADLVTSATENGDTALHLAATDGHVGIVYVLLECGADPNVKDREGKTALHAACFHGHADIVTALLDSGADIEAQDKLRATPLHIAVQEGHVQVVQILLSRGANKEHKAHFKWSLLRAKLSADEAVKKKDLFVEDWGGAFVMHAACLIGNEAIVSLLIEAGANLEAELWLGDEWGGERPLHHACAMGHRNIVKMLIDKGVDVTAENRHKHRPIHAACRGGDTEVLSMLLAAGEEVNVADRTLSTPLHHACMDGRADAAMFLIQNRAAIDARNSEGDTAFTLACWKGHKSTAILLKEHQADVKVTYKDNRSALHNASASGHVEVVEWLCELGVSVHEQSSNINHTPLHEAALAGHDDVIRVLFRNGAVVDSRNNDGDTAFILSCWKGHKSTAQVLKEFGADVKATNKENRSALHSASNSGHLEVVTWLINPDLGLPLEERNQINGQTPLCEAAYSGHDDVIRVLLQNGAAVDSRSDNGDTAFLLSCWQGHKSTAQLLAEHEADVKVTNKLHLSALHAAALRGHADIVKWLVGLGLPLDAKDNESKTAEQWASSKGHEEVVKILQESRS